MSAIIALFLSNLPALISAGESLTAYIEGMYATLSQTAEWTAAQEAAYQAAIQADAAAPAWQPDPPKTPPTAA
jgi:hypothetical protein